MSPSHLNESRLSSFGSIANGHSIAMKTNLHLQTIISVLGTQGNGAA